MAKLPEGKISMEEHHFQWVPHLHINGLLGYMMPTGKHTESYDSYVENHPCFIG